MAVELLSMTGYGEAGLTVDDFALRCVIQSVNSRNLDVRFRLPSALHSLESAFRRQLQKVITRGKVEVSFSITRAEASDGCQLSAAPFNAPWIRDFCSAGEDLLDSLQWQSTDRLKAALLNSAFSQRDAFTAADPELGALAEPLSSLLNDALQLHLHSRAAEGRLLRDDLKSRFSNLSLSIDSIANLAEGMPELFRDRLAERLSRLVDTDQFELDPARIAQEVAHLIDKADITEEIVRFNAHIQHCYTEIDNHNLDRRGKKLEFIVQEMLREINTVGSKANLLEITRIVVEVKNELEKIREQVQNIV